MRTLLILWLAPIAFFWSWYFLSLADLGGFILSRQMHDQVFQIYGDLLGIDPAIIPGMVARALAFDSIFVVAIILFRKRKPIIAWWIARRPGTDAEIVQPRSVDSLSNAP